MYVWGNAWLLFVLSPNRFPTKKRGRKSKTKKKKNTYQKKEIMTKKNEVQLLLNQCNKARFFE
jgi:hypothetical protein